jgi:hypothetical protein
MYTCECGKEFKRSLGLSTHKRLHCEKLKQPKVKKSCECKDGGTWEVISVGHKFYGSVDPETGKRFKQYCTVCLEGK